MKELYCELGGEQGANERIRTILAKFYKIMSADTMLGFFFHGKNLSHIVEQQSLFLLRAMGAAVSFTGLPPSKAHSKIPPILKGHFDRRLLILRDLLQSEELSAEAVETWIAFENQFRKVIVKEEGPLSPP
jgi:truncated hemoglobin YjbI